VDDMEAVELALDERPTLGVDAAPPGSFTQRVYLGRTQVYHLSSEGLSPEQQQVLKQRPDLHFAVASVPLTLVHDDHNPFESVWLQISLHSAPREGAAVARSMDPSMLFEPTESTQGGKLGASLKFTAELTRQVKTTGRAIYLEALYEGSTTPTWSFTKSGGEQIRGRYLLSMVIEGARDVTVEGTAIIGATIRARRLGIFSYRDKLPPSSASAFQLAAAPSGPFER
jgi:hypothetical protein